MSDDAADCTCVTDTSGLHAIATASANLKLAFIEKLKSGEMAVLTCAFNEFAELYPEEAEELGPHIATKINMGKAVYSGAARIADKLNSGFSRGPYDEHTELYTAAVATNKQLRIVTAAAQVTEYDGMDCDVIDLEGFIGEE